MKRFVLTMIFAAAVAVAAVFAFDACRSGGLSSTVPAVSDDDVSPDDDTSFDDDTAPDDDNDDNDISPDDDNDDDNDASPDDDNDDNDDTSPGETALAGQINCLDCTGSYAGDAVKVFVYTKWLPAGSQPVATQSFTTPTGGFPFAYSWNLSAADVAAGFYYVFAFLDVAGSGIIDPSVDPYYSPYIPTPVVQGQTTTLNISLVPPS